jgi:hypothetical protein
MKKLIVLSFALQLILTNCGATNVTESNTTGNEKENYIQLSSDLIQAIIKGEETEVFQQKLANVPKDVLANQLSTDKVKKVFWINVYNAYIQLILSENPSLYEDRGAFFKMKQIDIAGKSLSFDDIEHGIIRSSTMKLSLGLLKNPFVGKYERTFRTKNTDPRIHFALNCGAKSCPLVAAYQVENFNSKIDAVALNFLSETTTYDSTLNKVTTTSLFSWFRGDFGGKKGIRKFLKDYDLIPEDRKPELVFAPYNWELSLGNYYEE